MRAPIHIPIPVVVLTVSLSACSQMRVLRLPGSMHETVRAVEAHGDASDLAVHTLRASPDADSAAVRAAVERASVDALMRHTDRHAVLRNGTSFGEYVQSADFDWEDVVLVRHYRNSHIEGLLAGLAGGAISGGLIGLAITCVGTGCDPIGTPIVGLASGAAFGLVGAIVGGIRGRRRTVIWRR